VQSLGTRVLRNRRKDSRENSIIEVFIFKGLVVDATIAAAPYPTNPLDFENEVVRLSINVKVAC
jgi:hypothetical protein